MKMSLVKLLSHLNNWKTGDQSHVKMSSSQANDMWSWWPWNTYSLTYIISLRVLFPKNILESLWNQIVFEIEFWAVCHKIVLFWVLVSWIPSQNMSGAQIPGIITALWLRLVWIFCDLVNCLIMLISQITPGRRLLNLSLCKLQQILF